MSFRRTILRQVKEIMKSQVKINRTKRDVSPKKTIRLQIEEIDGGGTCGKADGHMYEPPRSRKRDWQVPPERNQPSMAQRQAHEPDHPPTTTSIKQEFTFLARHIRCPCLLIQGGSVKFTVPREFSTDLMVCEQD